jgi:chorismate synthase
MAGNSFGNILVLTTFGESHGPFTGGVLDGFPSNFPIDLDFIQSELNRRAPGSSEFTSPRKEDDRIEILSGIFEGKTTGAPIAFIIPNKDQKSEDYSHLKDIYRPSHADFTWEKKYGHRDYRGGGRVSARETAARVAGGAFARLFLCTKGISVNARICEIAGFRIPEEETQANEYLRALRDTGDTAGGIISCTIDGLPTGLGEPVFDKFQAGLAKAMLSINAVKGFEYGSGFAGARMKGSEHNDAFISGFRTSTNHSGGIQGGISNGMPVFFRVAFKPVSSIKILQDTLDKFGHPVKFTAGSRHDVCVLPRAVPIVEAMAALVIADYMLINSEMAKWRK